jgi:phosphoserine phosphatase
VPSTPWRLVTVDIDGTLTRGHGWLPIARQFGREPDFEALQRRFRAKELTEDENLAALLEFAEGRTLAEVESVVAATPKIDHIPEGVSRLHSMGVPVALLSHNPPYVTDWYCRFGGFDTAAGLGGLQPVEERIGRPVGIRSDKIGGFERLTRRFEVPPTAVVHIGDSRADAAVFPRVGRGIALNARFPEVDVAADLVLRSTDFNEVVEAVLHLGPRP